MDSPGGPSVRTSVLIKGRQRERERERGKDARLLTSKMPRKASPQETEVTCECCKRQGNRFSPRASGWGEQHFDFGPVKPI